MFAFEEKLKKQLIWYLPVIAAILVVSVYMARFSVISAMQGKGRYYVTKIEKVILKLETNNQVALSSHRSCSDVVKQLRYGNYLMRQLVVVKSGYVIYSSERGMINQDIRQYIKNGKLKPG